KLPSIFSSTLLLLLLFSPVLTQRKSDVDSVPFSPAPYQVGERLTYNVSFSNFISVAHVELRVIARGMFEGRDAVQIRAHVETSGVINAALFAINNEYLSYVDPETGLPFRSQQILRESMQTSDTSTDLNQSSITQRQKEGKLTGIFDFVSA